MKEIDVCSLQTNLLVETGENWGRRRGRPTVEAQAQGAKKPITFRERQSAQRYVSGGAVLGHR